MLKLRPVKMNDFKYFRRWWRDQELIRLTSGDYSNWPDSVIKDSVKRMIKSKKEKHWMINLNRRTIGHIFLIKLKQRQGELHIVIGEKNYWGRGYGSWALYQAARRAFRYYNCWSIKLVSRSTNYRIIRVNKKVGAVLVGYKYNLTRHLPKAVVMNLTPALLRKPF